MQHVFDSAYGTRVHVCVYGAYMNLQLVFGAYVFVAFHDNCRFS